MELSSRMLSPTVLNSETKEVEKPGVMLMVVKVMTPEGPELTVETRLMTHPQVPILKTRFDPDMATREVARLLMMTPKTLAVATLRTATLAGLA